MCVLIKGKKLSVDYFMLYSLLSKNGSFNDLLLIYIQMILWRNRNCLLKFESLFFIYVHNTNIYRSKCNINKKIDTYWYKYM
jgi:hypothetical protein